MLKITDELKDKIEKLLIKYLFESRQAKEKEGHAFIDYKVCVLLEDLFKEFKEKWDKKYIDI